MKRAVCGAGTSTVLGSVFVAGVAPARKRAANTGARRLPIMAGSRNLIGIKNPAIDALIERVIFASDGKRDLIAATKALDRALLWNHYVVPQWNYPRVRTARRDRFSRPAELPKYGTSAFPTIWWFDTEKANKIGRRS